METRLPSDFKEFLALLDSEKVEYLVVGGFAVSYYGYPRPTGDLDLWIATSPENAAKVAQALIRFGFVKTTIEPQAFTEPGRVFRMGVPPVRIELLTGISGVSFAECYARRVHADLDGISVPMISRADLITNKLATGRHKDLNDVERLRSG